MFDKILKNFLFIICSVFILSCYSNPSEVIPEQNVMLLDYSDVSYLNRMISYNIRIQIFTKELENSKKIIDDEIIKNKGITRNEAFSNQSEYRISLYIPKNNTSNFIESIRTLGIIMNENKDMTDQTAWYDNMEMRYQNVKNQLERYRRLLPTARNLTETITIEKEIERVEEGIKMMDMENKQRELMLNYAFIEINVIKLNNR